MPAGKAGILAILAMCNFQNPAYYFLEKNSTLCNVILCFWPIKSLILQSSSSRLSPPAYSGLESRP